MQDIAVLTDFLAGFKDSFITKISSYLIAYWCVAADSYLALLIYTQTWKSTLPLLLSYLLSWHFRPSRDLGWREWHSHMIHWKVWETQINGSWNSRNHCSWRRGIFTELGQQKSLKEILERVESKGLRETKTSFVCLFENHKIATSYGKIILF